MKRTLLVFMCLCITFVGVVPTAMAQGQTVSVYHDFRKTTPTATGLNVAAGDTLHVMISGEACFAGTVSRCAINVEGVGFVLFGSTDRSDSVRVGQGDGASATITAPKAGPVYVMMYDSAYGDNDGGFLFTISVDGGPGNKEDPTFLCRPFTKWWLTEYEIRTSDRREVTTNFATARLTMHVCYNGQEIYIEGVETDFDLLDDPIARGYRHLSDRDQENKIPEEIGFRTNYEARARYEPHFLMPGGGISLIGVSILGSGATIGFKDRGANVISLDFAMTINPQGCYVYTGGGTNLVCPYGRYDENN